jgi:quercetin dioxygenase-like cupin family protein
MPSLQVMADQVEPTPFQIPGATGGAFRIQILNEDAAAGVVTTIVHLPPGGRIPAHKHQAGSEMHFLLDGDLIEAGKEVAPGTCLTHAAGVVHGPHESRNGARLLTVQSWQSTDGGFDFEPAEETEAGQQPPRSGRRSPPKAGRRRWM